MIAILLENTGNPEGPSGEKVWLYKAALTGSAAPLTWRLMGDPGGTTRQDPVRGIMNATGLYGTDHGRELPGYRTRAGSRCRCRTAGPRAGSPPGVGWYRTDFSLNLPRDAYVPVDVQIGGPGPGAGTADYRAFIYVNGWLVGRYVNNVGPQHQFYVPAGILNDHGGNTLAIAVWGMSQAGGGLDQVSLVAAGNQAGAVPVSPVASPGYSAAIYGAPASPPPTLAAVPSTTLATSSFTVKETLADPAGPAARPLTGTTEALSAPSGWTVTPSGWTVTPSGWTVTPSGATSVGTIAPGRSASATFTITARRPALPQPRQRGRLQRRPAHLRPQHQLTRLPTVPPPRRPAPCRTCAISAARTAQIEHKAGRLTRS